MSNEPRMSDKAKGKQRAYPVNRDTKLGQETTNYVQTNPEPAKVQLAIRFVDGAPDMMLELSPDETGTSVISAMREQRPELASKQLRLIHSGRMLTGHTPLSMLRSTRSMALKERGEDKNEGLSRLSLSLPTGWLQDRPKEKTETVEDEESLLDNRVWLHCAVTEPEEEEAEEHESAGSDPLGSETPQAYDRFTDAGFSSADVQSIRALFRRVMFGSNANTSIEGASGGANGSASTPTWVPNTAEAHQLESQWLDSITQPSVFEELSSGHSESSPTPLARAASFLSYLLPTTNYASPARATTQGLIFAFFFPFIAGLAVSSETLVRPAAFFDGEIWPELNREAAEMYSAVEGDSDQDDDNGTVRTAESTQTAEDVTPREYITQEEPLVPSSSPQGSIELADPEERHSRVSRRGPRVFDTAMDPVPSLIFSPGMQSAIRAGLVLNFVTGFYLWLYAS